jgi:tape measure domain-containing protein
VSNSAIEAGRAYVVVELQQRIDRGVIELQNRLRSLSRELSEYGRSIAKVGAVIATSFGAALASLAIPVKVASDIQTVSAQFKALTGNAANAAKTINELRTFAAQTPYMFQGLADETRTLMIYGIAASQATRDIRLIAEVAGGSQVKLERLSLAFGQVASRGKLMATEVRQFNESGFNPLQELAEMTGKSMAQLTDEMSKGLISFDQVRQAFKFATSEGGRFFGLLKEASQTVNGLMTTLSDNIKIAIEPIGQELLPLIETVLRELNKAVGGLAKWIKANTKLVYTLIQVGAAGAIAGASIAAIGIGILAAGKTVEAFEALFVSGPRLFVNFAGSLSKTSAQSVVAASAMKDATQEAFADTIVLSTSVQKSLGSMGQSFNRLGSRTVGAMRRMNNAITRGQAELETRIAALLASLTSIAPGVETALAPLPLIIKRQMVAMVAPLVTAATQIESSRSSIVAAMTGLSASIGTAVSGLSSALTVEVTKVVGSLKLITTDFRLSASSVRRSSRAMVTGVKASSVELIATMRTLATGLKTQSLSIARTAARLQKEYVASMQAMVMGTQKATTRVIAQLERQKAAIRSYIAVVRKMPKNPVPVAVDAGSVVSQTVKGLGASTTSGASGTAKKAVTALSKATQDAAKAEGPDVLKALTQVVAPQSLDKIVDGAVLGALGAELIETFALATKPTPSAVQTVYNNLDELMNAAARSVSESQSRIASGVGSSLDDLVAAAAGSRMGAIPTEKRVPSLDEIVSSGEAARSARRKEAQFYQGPKKYSLPAGIDPSVLEEPPNRDIPRRTGTTLPMGIDPTTGEAKTYDTSANEAKNNRMKEAAFYRGPKKYSLPAGVDPSVLEEPQNREPRRRTMSAPLGIDPATGESKTYNTPGDKLPVSRIPKPDKASLDKMSKGSKDALLESMAQEALGVTDDLASVLADTVDNATTKASKQTKNSFVGMAKTSSKELSKGMGEFTESMSMRSSLPKLFAATDAAGTALKTVGSTAAKGAEKVGSGISAIFTRIGGMAKSVASFIAPLASFAVVGVEILAVVVAVGALAAAFTYLLNETGYLMPIVDGIKATFNSLMEIFTKVSQGVTDAITTGDWAGAIRVAWLGAKVAFYRGLNAIVDAGGLSGILQKVLTFFNDMQQAVINGMINLAKKAPDIFWSVITGVGDIKSLVADAFFGGADSSIKKYAQDAEAEFSSELSRLGTNKDKKIANTKNAAMKEYDRANAARMAEEENADYLARTKAAYENLERQSQNLKAGVDAIAAALPQEEINAANASAIERVKTLKEEALELQMGKEAYDQYKLRLAGVTEENRRAVSAMELYKKSLEANNKVKDEITKAQEDIAALRTNADLVARQKLAQDGANQSLLANLALLQQQKIVVEQMTTAQGQINEALLGADAANALKLAQQGLTREQVASVASIQQFAKRLVDLRTYSDQLKEKFKSPLQSFQETASKIRDAQTMGMINQQVAAQAYSEAMQEMQKKSEELKKSAREPLTTLGTTEARSEHLKKLQAMAQTNIADARGRDFAARNEQVLQNMKQSGMQVSPLEQRQLELLGQSTSYLRDIKTAIEKTKLVQTQGI